MFTWVAFYVEKAASKHYENFQLFRILIENILDAFEVAANIFKLPWRRKVIKVIEKVFAFYLPLTFSKTKSDLQIARTHSHREKVE